MRMSFNDNSKELLISFLKNKQIDFENNFDLKKRSWLKAGGVFETYIKPNSHANIMDLVKFFKKNNYNYYVVGNLSNIIFRDGVIKTPIINLKNFNKILEEEHSEFIKVNACCGISIYKFVSYISQNLRITGTEGLVGIPGSLGGGIYMNASSYNSCISDYLTSIEYINQNYEVEIVNKNDAKLGWRNSIFHNIKNLIILNATFQFPKKNKKDSHFINKNIQRVKNHRTTFQEKKLPNLGSLFATKNLYWDISKSSILFKILYLLYILITKLIIKFLSEKSLLRFRKFAVSIYSYCFGIKKNSSFKLSERTINCLVNNNSSSANEAIKIIKTYQKKIKFSQRLENIIVEDIF